MKNAAHLSESARAAVGAVSRLDSGRAHGSASAIYFIDVILLLALFVLTVLTPAFYNWPPPYLRPLTQKDEPTNTALQDHVCEECIREGDMGLALLDYLLQKTSKENARHDPFGTLNRAVVDCITERRPRVIRIIDGHATFVDLFPDGSIWDSSVCWTTHCPWKRESE